MKEVIARLVTICDAEMDVLADNITKVKDNRRHIESKKALGEFVSHDAYAEYTSGARLLEALDKRYGEWHAMRLELLEKAQGYK